MCDETPTAAGSAAKSDGQASPRAGPDAGSVTASANGHDHGHRAPLQVLVWVEGPALHAEGLRALLTLLSSELNVAAVATTLEDVPTMVEGGHPDIAILHGRRIGWSLVETARTLRERVPATKVAVLAETTDQGGAQDLMRVGVHGLFSAQVTPERLLAALRLIGSGQVVMDPTVLGVLLDRPALRGSASLSAFELRILKLVAEGRQNDEIAAELAVSTSTLKRNLRAIRAKLSVGSRVGAAAYAAKAGLV